MNTIHQHYTLASTVRRERDGGREYIVAPVTLIVPGVLQGSRGALFYPEHEVAKNARAWNGMPLTIGHPSINGHPVAANTPGITHIGTVRNAGMSGGKLTGEAWIDADTTRRVHPRLYNAVQQGKPVEVSTGLYTQNEPAPTGAAYRGREYTHVVRDYRPDHLAILPDDRGACSIDDGCGLNNNCGEYLEETVRRITEYAAYLKESPTMNRTDVMPTAEIEWATGEVVITNTGDRCGCEGGPGDTPPPVYLTPDELREIDALFDDAAPPVVNRNDTMPTTEIDWATGEIVTKW